MLGACYISASSKDAENEVLSRWCAYYRVLAEVPRWSSSFRGMSYANLERAISNIRSSWTRLTVKSSTQMR